jgi:hypothetical protein
MKINVRTEASPSSPPIKHLMPPRSRHGLILPLLAPADDHPRAVWPLLVRRGRRAFSMLSSCVRPPRTGSSTWSPSTRTGSPSMRLKQLGRVAAALSPGGIHSCWSDDWRSAGHGYAAGRGNRCRSDRWHRWFGPASARSTADRGAGSGERQEQGPSTHGDGDPNRVSRTAGRDAAPFPQLMTPILASTMQMPRYVISRTPRGVC